MRVVPRCLSRLPIIRNLIRDARSFSDQSLPSDASSSLSMITPRRALNINLQGEDQSDTSVRIRLNVLVFLRANPYFNAHALGHCSINVLRLTDQAFGLLTHVVLLSSIESSASLHPMSILSSPRVKVNTPEAAELQAVVSCVKPT